MPGSRSSVGEHGRRPSPRARRSNRSVAAACVPSVRRVAGQGQRDEVARLEERAGRRRRRPARWRGARAASARRGRRPAGGRSARGRPRRRSGSRSSAASAVARLSRYISRRAGAARRAPSDGHDRRALAGQADRRGSGRRARAGPDQAAPSAASDGRAPAGARPARPSRARASRSGTARRTSSSRPPVEVEGDRRAPEVPTSIATRTRRRPGACHAQPRTSWWAATLSLSSVISAPLSGAGRVVAARIDGDRPAEPADPGRLVDVAVQARAAAGARSGSRAPRCCRPARS